jgi:putative membrane protein
MTPSPTSFTFEPLFLALAAVAALVYLRAWRREGAPGWRAWLFCSGLFLIAAAVNSPLETLAAHYLLLMHLFQNVVIADWAPLLIVLGLTPTMRERIAAHGGRSLDQMSRLRVALPIWLAGWYAVHLAVFYDNALESPWLLNLEHLVLVAIGLVFWWPLFSDVPHAASTPARIGYLGAGFVFSTFLALGLTFAGSSFYDFYEDAPRLWGLSALQDQNLGGVLMGAEQAILFLAAIGYFLIRLLNEEEAQSRILHAPGPATPPPPEGTSGAPEDARERISERGEPRSPRSG